MACRSGAGLPIRPPAGSTTPISRCRASRRKPCCRARGAATAASPESELVPGSDDEAVLLQRVATPIGRVAAELQRERRRQCIDRAELEFVVGEAAEAPGSRPFRNHVEGLREQQPFFGRANAERDVGTKFVWRT